MVILRNRELRRLYGKTTRLSFPPKGNTADNQQDYWHKQWNQEEETEKFGKLPEIFEGCSRKLQLQFS